MDLPEELLVFRSGSVQYGVDMRCVRGLRPHRQPGSHDWGVELQLVVNGQPTVLEADEITPMARPEPAELHAEPLDLPPLPFPLLAQADLPGRTVHLLDIQALATRH
jgi:hypothetical protein